MAFESVRGYLQLASGLGEMTRARAMEAAQGLLSLPGADEVGRAALQASALADQLLEAAKANRRNLVELVRNEVDSALTRADVPWRAELEAAVSSLTREVDDLRVMALEGAARSPLGRALPGMSSAAVSTTAGRLAHDVSVPEVTVPPLPSTPAREAASQAGRPVPRKRAATTGGAATKKSTAKKTTAKKAGAAKKTTAKKAGAAPARKTAAAKGTTAKRSTAAKSTTTKATTKKASTAKASTARKSTAKASTAKTSTARKSTAKKSTETPATATPKATT